MLETNYGIGSEDYGKKAGPKLLYVTMMPSFLPSLDKRFKEAGFQTKLHLYSEPTTRSLVNLIADCNEADVIFCEFIQTPMDVVTAHIDKPIFGRLWRCELYNPKFIDNVYWTKVKALFVPTESVETKFRILRDKKLSTEIIRFKAPAIDLETYPFLERDFSQPLINIGILGNVIPRKRQFDAVQLMLDIPENYRLSIGGDFKDKEYATHTRDFIARNKLSGRVRLLGKIYPKAICEFFGHHHIILGLSTEETGHYSIAEAMATGCYPIMSEWWGSEGIYPDSSRHKSFINILAAIQKWGRLAIEQKLAYSKGARIYVRDYLNSKVCDKEIVNHVKGVLNGL